MENYNNCAIGKLEEMYYYYQEEAIFIIENGLIVGIAKERCNNE